MSRMKDAFVERCLRGEALLDEIDDEVDAWHTGKSDCSLARYLGLSDEEYAMWVEEPDALRAIIYARRRHLPLVEALELSAGVSIAARASSKVEAKKIVEWLKKTGRLN